MKILINETWQVVTIYLEDPRQNPASGSFDVKDYEGHGVYEVRPNVGTGMQPLPYEDWSAIKKTGDFAYRVAAMLTELNSFEIGADAIRARYRDAVLDGVKP